MKPDVKKIIADIKATKGNRKFCNGLAGTLQDDNYASSICKYVKTVTPERIDLLIEYAEKLEAEVTDMAVQLANAESKCRELAAESSGMNVFIEEECFVYSSDTPEPIDANDCKPETPATDAFLAEVRAQGVDAAIDHLSKKFEVTGHIGVPVMALEWLAQEIRKGAAQ
ncbi:hypothetical protein [Citrobacter sp. FDAARGOS_156]|uniref:hypothetical protein n=1 Tax=Citrobacter sp. FDAARGOS_156 TaxID=1702170 RepID=UPI001F2CAFF7|nr:hypothetical protein [Citrobacter sp. FDAARGOS_156]